MPVLICMDFHRMSNREQPIEILLELRKKVVYAVVHHKMKKSTAAKLFGFCATSVGKYVREYEELLSNLVYGIRRPSCQILPLFVSHL